MPTKPKSTPVSPLHRAITARERGIAKMQREIDLIEQRSREEVAAVRKRIASKRVLLDALKRGELKP